MPIFIYGDSAELHGYYKLFLAINFKCKDIAICDYSECGMYCASGILKYKKERKYSDSDYLVLHSITFRRAVEILTGIVDDDERVKGSGLISTWLEANGIRTFKDLKECLLLNDLNDILEPYFHRRCMEENGRLITLFRLGIPEITPYL